MSLVASDQLQRYGGPGRCYRAGGAGYGERSGRVRVGAPRDEEVPGPSLRPEGMLSIRLFILIVFLGIFALGVW